MHEALDLRYHSEYAYADFVNFINRAKDELVTPDDFEAWVDTERAIFEERYGSYATIEERLRMTGTVRGTKETRGAVRRASAPGSAPATTARWRQRPPARSPGSRRVREATRTGRPAA